MPPTAIHEVPEAQVLDERFWLIVNETNRLIDEVIKMKEQALDSWQNALDRLKETYRIGIFSTTENQYMSELSRCEIEISKLSTDIVILCTSRQTILDDILDNGPVGELPLGPYKPKNWQFIEQQIIQRRSSYKQQPLLLPVSHLLRDRFQMDLYYIYGMMTGGRPARRMVTLRDCGREYLSVAYFVRYQLDSKSTCHLFGPANDGHIMNLQSGLPIIPAYRSLFRDARIAFVPVDKEGKSWKIVVLDEALLHEPALNPSGDPWGNDLQGRLLQFPDDCSFRPAMNYAYFGFFLNILWRQRYKAKGWWKTCVDLDGIEWGPTDHYPRPSTLKMLARQIGRVAPDEVDDLVRMFGVTHGKPDLDLTSDSEYLDGMIAKSILSQHWMVENRWRFHRPIVDQLRWVL
ncbi:hypothetical protein F5Y13DRAFT_203066 [Hypoxylon sp. FL1857]|nr:hypothetical protein F5Y13DRAFT_203066 [Hypoxylon sp. FL1857]